MEDEKVLQIKIDERKIVEAAVEHLISRGTYSESGEDFFPSQLGERLQKKIEERLEEAMRSAFTEALLKRIHARAEAIVEEVVAAGFPNYDRDGRELPAEPFRVYVRKAIDQMFVARSYSKSSAAELAEKSAGDVSAVVGRLGLVQPGRRPVGLDAGRFVVPDDFDADLPEDVLAGFGGEDPR